MQVTTRTPARGDEWPEGFSVGLAFNSLPLVTLTVQSREGDVASIPMTASQAKRLSDLILQYLDHISEQTN